MNRKETDYYAEIAVELVKLFKANFNDDRFEVKPLIGEVSSGLRTLIANGFQAQEKLQNYANSVHILHLDISIVVEDTQTGNFELIIFEIKKVASLGLTQLSQLIGYCLVSKSKFGILVNIDKNVSSHFAGILNSDNNLTRIERIIDKDKLLHQFGVMVWNSTTQKIEYTHSGALETIPQLVNLVKENIL